MQNTEKRPMTPKKLLSKQLFASKRLLALLLVGLLVGTGSGATQAQETPASPAPPAFAQLFTQPTGMNGYEEWVQAGDLIRDNKYLDAATDQGATLTFKRRVLADANVQKALHLLRDGLSKPSASPHVMPDENTQLPELTLFRKLARLLSVEMYVQFAEGRTDAAIDTFYDGLRFGYRTQTNTIISGLVGIAIDAIVLKAVSTHLDQLSDYQCNRVRRMVEEWLDWPSPAASVLNSEKQFALRSLDSKRNDPKALRKLFESIDTPAPDSPDTERIQKVTNYLDRQPTDLGVAIDTAEAMIRRHYDTAITNLRLPVQERIPTPVISDKSLGGELYWMMAASTDQVVDKYDRIDALMRLLGTHVAILDYRWEHDRLPTTLTELHLGKLGIDPFTGASLTYLRKGKDFDLSSRGPVVRDQQGLPTGTLPPPLQLSK